MKIHVEALSLSQFRNYEQASIKVDARPVVIVGANGAGKTNILEAISLLVPGRGLRRAKVAEMDNVHKGGPWAVAAEVQGMKGLMSVGTGRDTSGGEDRDKRIIKINGKVARAHTELADIFSVLWLTPEMDTLFIEGTSPRRKFIDRLVFSFDGEHAARTNAYEQVMRERNRLLFVPNADAQWISALEKEMAEFAIAIAVARNDATAGVNNAMKFLSPAFPKVQVELAGVVETLLAEGSALEAEEKLKELLLANRVADAAAGRALLGVHRTGVLVTHQEKNMPAELCSTGEQKAVLISIILAQARAGALWHGNVPALLLDEVATHLDAAHRTALFKELESIGAQAWLTGTDADIFEGLDWQFLQVKNGKATRMLTPA